MQKKHQQDIFSKFLECKFPDIVNNAKRIKSKICEQNKKTRPIWSVFFYANLIILNFDYLSSTTAPASLNFASNSFA